MKDEEKIISCAHCGGDELWNIEKWIHQWGMYFCSIQCPQDYERTTFHKARRAGLLKV